MTNTDKGNHFSCSTTAVLIGRIRAKCGEAGVKRLLAESGCKHSVEYLEALGNWICFDDMIALFDAGELVTGDRRFAYNVGVDAGVQLAGSPVAALLRSMGSTEAVYRQMVNTGQKFNTVTIVEVDTVEPGFARLKIAARPGFPRSRAHCENSQGLFTCTPSLFGLPPSTVEHRECAADGQVSACTYEIRWDLEKPADAGQDATQTAALKAQLDAMTKRLQGVFATAADLIASDDIDVTLARITDRAALEVRAPRHLLAVRAAPDGRLHIHHRGFDEVEAAEIAQLVLNDDPESLPNSWIVAEVRSHRHDYGRLVAMYELDESFMDEERELLEVYSHYAATALDSATALLEARRRHAEANALLELARSLASAGSRAETIIRLCEAVPAVVDCDRVSVLTWDARRSELGYATVADRRNGGTKEQHRIDPEILQRLASRLSGPDAAAVFIDLASEDGDERRILVDLDATGAVIVPIRSCAQFLGALVLSAENHAERLRPTAELTSLLSGVAAHATSALENGILVDTITYQARHDGLTGLANRAFFAQQLNDVATNARSNSHPFSLFYIDIDLFKSINDELGHVVGDALLRQVADRLLGCVRDADMVARVGGDEYAVIVEGTDDDDTAEAVAERLADAFVDPFDVDDRRIDVKVSIGRANWHEHAEELDALVRHADTEMYNVKRIHHTALAAQREPVSVRPRAA